MGNLNSAIYDIVNKRLNKMVTNIVARTLIPVGGNNTGSITVTSEDWVTLAIVNGSGRLYQYKGTLGGYDALTIRFYLDEILVLERTHSNGNTNPVSYGAELLQEWLFFSRQLRVESKVSNNASCTVDTYYFLTDL